MAGPNKECIHQFRSFVSSMPGYVSNRVVLLNRHVPGNPVLARPAAHADEKHIVVGTENAGDTDQVLLCLNAQVIIDSMVGDPLITRIPLPKAVQDTHWINDHTVLVCVGGKEGPSEMLLFNIDLGGSCQFELKDNSVKTTETVREIAVSSVDQNRIAYGGFDQKISILDFNHGPKPTAVFDAAGDISSVRWEPYHSNRLVSCTTNEGQLRIFDVLGSSKEPSWLYKTDIRSHLNLYTHCQVSEYQVLLGYEDNYIEAVDIRKNQESLGNFMTGTTDPYCFMVGDLHYRQASGLLLATGMADFSVYKHFRSGADKSVAKLWCHSTASANREINDNNAVRHGVFFRDNWVVSTQESSLGLFKIE